MLGALLFALVASSLGAKPEFRTPFENVAIKAGKWVYLVCEAEGDKPMTYKWYNQDENEMTVDDKQPVYVKDWGNASSALFFKNVSSRHEGSYTCIASNAHGMTSKVFFLTVPPPNDGNDTDIDRGNGTSRIRDVKVLKYTARSVTFYITTSEPVKYIEAKYREGKRESNTTTIRLNPAPGNNTYEIGNLLPSGLYTFQFRALPSESNKWSRVQYYVTLLPDSPEIILESTNDQSVRLQFFLKTDDVMRGTIDRHQIKYFPVEMVDGSNWTSRNCSVTTEVPTCVGSLYTIWGLERTIFYQIEVRAHTDAGYGEPWRQKVYLP